MKEFVNRDDNDVELRLSSDAVQVKQLPTMAVKESKLQISGKQLMYMCGDIPQYDGDEVFVGQPQLADVEVTELPSELILFKSTHDQISHLMTFVS